MTLFDIEIKDKPIKDSSFNQCFWQIKNDGGIMSQLVDVLTNSSDWTSSRCTMEWRADYVKKKRYIFILHINRTGDELSDNDILLPTPTMMEDRRIPNGTERDKYLKSNMNLYTYISELNFQQNINENNRNPQLNPNFVLEMMGFPADYIQLPFNK